MPSQHVRVTMRGGFEVEVDGVAVPASVWRLKKARSLVKLLALSEGNSVHRDAVVDALWPGLTAASGTNNLHQALHAARRALAVAGASEDVLRFRDGIVALHPDGGITTDIGELEKQLDAAVAADDLDSLLDVATRCADGLLPEDRYEDWARPYQDHLTDLRRRAVLAVAAGLTAAGRAYEAASALQPLAEVRPSDEELHRTLMAAYDALSFAERSWRRTTPPGVAGTLLRSMSRCGLVWTRNTPLHRMSKRPRSTADC